MKGPIGVAGLAAVLLLARSPGGPADGLPVGGVDAGGAGVGTAQRARPLRDAAGRARHRGRARAAPGRARARLAPAARHFTVPAVALDGVGERAVGRRPDARADPARGARFPQAHTSLAVLDTRRPAAAAGRLTLQGDFTFDALSPDGTPALPHPLPLAQGPGPLRGPRARPPAGRLAPAPIVDPREPDERDARAADHARWRLRGRPLALHALRRRGIAPVHPRPRRRRPQPRSASTCPGSPVVSDLYDLRLGLHGRRGLAVLAAGEPLALVDPRDVPACGRPAATARKRGHSAGAGGSPTWRLLALACLPAVAAGAALALVRRRRRAPGRYCSRRRDLRPGRRTSLASRLSRPRDRSRRRGRSRPRTSVDVSLV